MSHLCHPAAKLPEEEEEDPLPPEIELDESTMICSLDCHPRKHLLAVGLVDGTLHLYRYGLNLAQQVSTKKAHKDACRDVAFSPSGASLTSVAANRHIRTYDVRTGAITLDCRRPPNHKAPVNRVKYYQERAFFTGDDGGIVLMWDARTARPVSVIDDNADQITSITVDEPSQYAYITALDGCVIVVDLRRKKGDRVETCIGPMKHEMTCSAMLDGGNQVAVGTVKGTLYTWSNQRWLTPSGKVKGHPSEIQCMLSAGDEHVLTGAADGVIRYIRLLPDHERAFDRVVAEHKEPGLDLLVEFGVEVMKYSHERSWLAYSSHDYCIHWADVSDLAALPAGGALPQRRKRKGPAVTDSDASALKKAKAEAPWYAQTPVEDPADPEANDAAAVEDTKGSLETKGGKQEPEEEAEGEEGEEEEEEEEGSDDSDKASDSDGHDPDRPKGKVHPVREMRMHKFYSQRKAFFAQL